MVETIKSSIEERRRAKSAHELFTVNMVLVNIFMSLGLVKLLGVTMATSVMITIVVSLGFMLHTYIKRDLAAKVDGLLSYYHWNLCVNRYKILMGGYIYYFMVGLISGYLTKDQATMMDGVNVIQGVMNMVSIVPLFVIILVMTILGSGSLFNAGRGEIDITESDMV